MEPKTVGFIFTLLSAASFAVWIAQLIYFNWVSDAQFTALFTANLSTFFIGYHTISAMEGSIAGVATLLSFFAIWMFCLDHKLEEKIEKHEDKILKLHWPPIAAIVVVWGFFTAYGIYYENATHENWSDAAVTSNVKITIILCIVMTALEQAKFGLILLMWGLPMLTAWREHRSHQRLRPQSAKKSTRRKGAEVKVTEEGSSSEAESTFPFEEPKRARISGGVFITRNVTK
jgi:hypothetical protein